MKQPGSHAKPWRGIKRRQPNGSPQVDENRISRLHRRRQVGHEKYAVNAEEFGGRADSDSHQI